MIKTECNSCSSSYNIDERRIPPKGMKMRCPKCGNSFLITAPGSTLNEPLAPTSHTIAGNAPSPTAANPIPPPPPTPASVERKAGPQATLMGQPPASVIASEIPPEEEQRAATIMGIGVPSEEKKNIPLSTPSHHPESDGELSYENGGVDQQSSTAAQGEEGQMDEGEVQDLPALKLSKEKRSEVLPSYTRESASLNDSDSDSDGDLPVFKRQERPLSNRFTPDRSSTSEIEIEDLPVLKSVSDADDLKDPHHPAVSKDVDLPELPALKTKVDFPAVKKERSEFKLDSDPTVELPSLKSEIDPATKEYEFSQLSELPIPRSKGDSTTKENGKDDLYELPVPKLEIDKPTKEVVTSEYDFSSLELPDLPAPKQEHPSVHLPTGKDVSNFSEDPTTTLLDQGFGSIDLPLPETSTDLPTLTKPGTVQGIKGPTRMSDEKTQLAGQFDYPEQLEVENSDGSSFFDGNPSQGLPPNTDTLTGGPRLPIPPKAPFSPADTPTLDSLSPDDFSEIPELLDQDLQSIESNEGIQDNWSISSPEEISPAGVRDDPDASNPSNSLIDEDLDWGAQPEAPSDIDSARDVHGRKGIGGANFGEVELGSDGIQGFGDSIDEEMEFGIPDLDDEVGDQSVISLPPEILRRQRGIEFEAKRQAYARKTLRLSIKIGILLIILAGMGMSLGLTEYGFFGMYYLEQFLPSAGNPAYARDAIKDAENVALSDTYRDVRQSLKTLATARTKTGLNRLLLSRSLLHESLFLVRFGQNITNASRAAAILARLQERGGKAEGIALARAADSLRSGALDQTDRYLQSARLASPSDPYLELVAGELALRQKKWDLAEKTFSKAVKLGGSARAQWGLTRAVLQTGQIDQKLSAIEETLKLSPRHADALIAKASLLIVQGKESQAFDLLEIAVANKPLDGEYIWTSKLTLSKGFSTLGYLYEINGRLPKARKAYERALSANLFDVEALLGAGRVALKEHRHSDALARFEAALNTTKTDNPILLNGRTARVDSELGISRSFLKLNRAQEARDRLESLAGQFPNDSKIILWLGKVYHFLSKFEIAEQKYRKAIELKPNEFEGYLELAQLFFTQKMADKAVSILNEAAAHVEESAEMRRMLGQSELARNRIDNAIHEFKRAVELDADDLNAQFGLGVAFRRNGQLTDAKVTFDRIERRDSSFVGLSVERGLLFEAQGDFSKAVESYRSALSSDPENTDLLLRLGAAQVEAGNLEEATATLDKVIQVIPNSAEAEHLIGRIDLAKGRTPDALIHFDRSVSLDGTRALFHLYAGRAALEMSNLGKTIEEAQATIDRDPSIGDAYWLRGIVRMKTGAVKDALEDLKRALTLSPSRFEAYAGMGDCYDEMRMLDAAVRSYRKALEFDPENGYYWYRLGRLELDLSHSKEAIGAFKQATIIGDKMPDTPKWLPDAHRLAGNIYRLVGQRQTAIAHYQRFLELADYTVMDRKEVEGYLKRWGIVLDKKTL